MKPIPREFNGKIVPEVIERVGFDKMFEMIGINSEDSTCYAGGITVCNERSSDCNEMFDRRKQQRKSTKTKGLCYE